MKIRYLARAVLIFKVNGLWSKGLEQAIYSAFHFPEVQSTTIKASTIHQALSRRQKVLEPKVNVISNLTDRNAEITS